MCNPNNSSTSARARRRLQQHRLLGFVNPEFQAVASKKSDSKLTQNLFGEVLLNGLRNEFPVEQQNTINVDHSMGFTAPPSLPTSLPKKDLTSHGCYSVPTFSAFHPIEELPKPKKPKRRRKLQQPGKTAKQNDRHFVVHNYHNHADDADEHEAPEEGRRRGGVAISFPQKLHTVLDQVEADGLAHVLSWQPHGRCFVIRDPKQFTEHVMPHYFRQTKLTSFQRQLNLYGFNRLTRGNDGGGYYHELFLRGREHLCKRMARTKVKGTKFKAASSPEQEPDFFAMPPVLVTPSNSDCDTIEDEHQSSYSMYSFEQPPPLTTHSTIFDPTIRHQPPIGDPNRYQQYPTPVYDTPSALAPAREESSQQMLLHQNNSYSICTHASTASVPAVEPQLEYFPSDHNDASLDQAVEELFLNHEEARPENIEYILDFVNSWDPASFGEDAALENDTQLGNLLDKILVDEV